MSKRTFTDEQVTDLSHNPYVQNVSPKAITYSDEFKVHFLVEWKKGKTARQIFTEASFPVEVLGERRIHTAANRWKKAYQKSGITGVRDQRKGASGRPRLTELSTEEQLRRAKQENVLLRQENELLKKIDFAERRGNELSKQERFALIQQVTSRPGSLSVRRACLILEVSNSGYYAHFSPENQCKRQEKEEEDQRWRDRVLEAMAYKRVAKGSRAIVMYFLNTKKTVVNRKKVQRIMRKYGLQCPIRRANPYRKIAKATQEHRTVPNRLQRQFDQSAPKKVLLTDITYLRGKDGFLGYLSTILDGATKEVLAYAVADRITLDIALDTVKDLVAKHGEDLPAQALLHSDQGSHYTSPIFQKLVQKNGLTQSMSRRGNCWDNAPQESYFGHLKDEIPYEECHSLEELQSVIINYMDYYNHERGQWKLKKLTPVSYRDQLLKQVA